jgi:3D (Asp-Asp-Asp) domain-containing protein
VNATPAARPAAKRPAASKPLISDRVAIDWLRHGGPRSQGTVDAGYGDLIAAAKPMPLQAKLAIGTRGDRFEQEADRVAEMVTRPDAPSVRTPLRTTATGSTVQACAACEHDAPGAETIAAARTAGTPLPPATRARFESRFGHDFGDVRIHTASAAAASARTLGARAYTTGRDIVFAYGQFAPETSDGQKLLAHELTHVVQQRQGSGGVPDIQRDDHAQTPAPIPWKYHYASKDNSTLKSWIASLTQKGITVDGPLHDKEGWTFIIHPMSEAEARLAADALAKANPTHAVAVSHAKLAKGMKSIPFVEDIPKCPDSISVTPPERVWPKCFATEKAAQALKTKFDKAHLGATVVPVTEKSFGVRFHPLTQAEAQAAGDLAASQIPVGPDEMTHKAITSENKDLDSFTFDVRTECPAGAKDLGAFLVTTYVVAQEKDFPAGKTESDDSLPDRKFRKGFLTSDEGPLYGVRKEGVGRALNGDLINFADGKFTVGSCAHNARGGCLTPNVSIAVSKDIPLGVELSIEGIGKRTTADHGGQINSHHIDLFVGETMTAREAFKQTFEHRKVCQNKKSP